MANISWIFLALLGAFAQALGAAIKKKSLQTPGMNNAIGFISFTVAGLIFGLVCFLKTGTIWHPGLSARFWQGMFWYAGLNVIAVWFMYRALDSAEFNYLMPFMTLTSLSMIIPPIFVFGEIPSVASFLGIALIVIGVLYMNYLPKKSETAVEKKRKQDNRHGIMYFTVTAICYAITPTAAKVAIQESSILFTSFLVHLLIGLGFLGMIIILRENNKFLSFVRDRKMRGLLVIIMLAGVIAFVENGSINAALLNAPVAYVMALKRLMPFFAFFIGLVYFKERTEIPKKILATAIMVAGAIITVILK